MTDETLVAEAAPPGLQVYAPERDLDADLAHRTSIAMSRAAFRWFHARGSDRSCVSGISAGDLAGGEAALTVLMPAARGVLTMLAALERGISPTRLVQVLPSGEGRYSRLEGLAADAALAALRTRLGTSVEVERIVSADPRNALLREKYALARDPDYLLSGRSRRWLPRGLALGLANLPARLRGRSRPTLLVLEYNPSRAFARVYGARERRRWRLLCVPATPRDLFAIARGADEAMLPSAPDLSARPPTAVGDRLRRHAGELEGRALSVAGVDLWPVVGERLIALAERYGRYAAALAEPLGRELERRSVRAVLVPFDLAAPARLLVRVAQRVGVPTFVIADGYKNDEIQQEGMTADVALAWSSAMSSEYYARREKATVTTGNPRFEHRPLRRRRSQRRVRRVLVGGHTFSPIDLNCGRSDAERFLDEVLAGVSAARPEVSGEVLVKLHPSDATRYYRATLARHPALEVELRREGDVVELFGRYDVYVTTYSTSLLEALASGLPVVYYRVNSQRLGPPFGGDEFLARRSASTPAELTSLLRDREALSALPAPRWLERYLGPATGATERIVDCIQTHLDPATPHASPSIQIERPTERSNVEFRH